MSTGSYTSTALRCSSIPPGEREVAGIAHSARNMPMVATVEGIAAPRTTCASTSSTRSVTGNSLASGSEAVCTILGGRFDRCSPFTTTAVPGLAAYPHFGPPHTHASQHPTPRTDAGFTTSNAAPLASKPGTGMPVKDSAHASVEDLCALAELQKELAAVTTGSGAPPSRAAVHELLQSVHQLLQNQAQQTSADLTTADDVRVDEFNEVRDGEQFGEWVRGGVHDLGRSVWYIDRCSPFTTTAVPGLAAYPHFGPPHTHASQHPTPRTDAGFTTSNAAPLASKPGTGMPVKDSAHASVEDLCALAELQKELAAVTTGSGAPPSRAAVHELLQSVHQLLQNQAQQTSADLT
ncbi:hypothetical protein AMAG_09974 [Allomyces macrogynus ATCC 38327]|uniref:Uncharacterized protein n=2 Tax=Allomyces macrogynus (strain ATCC 38327) TaxID=578462 RepID=A0A0L0SQG7_ALLM3|nr:hypothetical protein AMAG_09974 [Allomyces macrogynus ATCC 38327]|eukprot:KNE64619.1 hypothetical protein AMAG_09974 [Allomyces macrogynus ATCC 38327]